MLYYLHLLKEYLYSDQNFYNAFISTCVEFIKTVMLTEYQRIKDEEARKLSTTSPYEAILAQLR